MLGFGARGFWSLLISITTLAASVVIFISCSGKQSAHVTAAYGGAQSGGTVSSRKQDSDDQNDSDDEDEDEGDDDETVSQDQASICSSFSGVDSSKIVLIEGRDVDLTLSSGQALAIKIAGNHPSLDLKIDAGGGVALPAICIFSSGNHPSVTVNVTTTVGAFYYQGSGNHSSATFHLNKPASVGSFKIALRGNQPQITIDGDGSYSCPSTSDESGNGVSLTCHQN